MGPESLRGGSRARTGFRTQALEPACLLECWQRLTIWACVWKASPGGIDSSFPFLISLLVLCTLICFLGVPLQALTFSPFLQCLRSFGPLALYSLTPPSTSPSSLPPLDWSRQLSYLPGKDQKTQLRAMGPSPRKLLGMVTSQKRPRGRQRKMSQEPGRRHSKLTLTASHMAPRLWVWTSLCQAWSMCMGSLSMQTT